MVSSKFVKYLIICAIINITTFSLFYNLNLYKSETRYREIRAILMNKSLKLKSILIWTSIEADPIQYFGEGLNTFINRGCSFSNCYVTSNRRLLKDVADFDVIVFHGPEIIRTLPLPQSRSPHQKYVFASMESSAYYPVCNEKYNNYFNWTFAYKLDSDEVYGYMTITDKENKIIGPKKEMHWMKLEAMKPINDTLKAKLSTKRIAAAWFVSNCKAPSGRDKIAKRIQTELAKYDMQVDIYGNCGTMECPRDSMEECLQKLETDYYFYFCFENSFAEDYVTEKLLHALNHYAVPVVYGGANYTRFMPDGIYLTAEQSRIRELAKEMVDIINDKQKYYDFFKWHNHYSYNEPQQSNESDNYCKFCALVNNKEQFLRTSVYENFIDSWNPENYKCQ